MEVKSVTITTTNTEQEQLAWVVFPDGSRHALIEGMVIPAGSIIEQTKMDQDCKVTFGLDNHT